MKTLLQSMWKIAREGSIAVAVSVTMVSASVAAAAPPPGNANGGASTPAVAKTSWSDKLLGGIVSATMWTVGAPFPENTSKAGRIARIGAGIGLALAGGIVVTAATMATAPVWVAALGVTAGVGLILTGMHYGFGGWFAGTSGGHDSPVVVAPTSPTTLPGNPTAPDAPADTTGRPTNGGTPGRIPPPHVIPRLPHGPSNPSTSSPSSTGSASTNSSPNLPPLRAPTVPGNSIASPATTPGNNVSRNAPTLRAPVLPGNTGITWSGDGAGVHR